MAAGSCGWGTVASGSAGGDCGAAGRTAPAAAPQGCRPRCWSLAPSETATCLNLVRQQKKKSDYVGMKETLFVCWCCEEVKNSLCAMAMTPDRGMMRFCVCWWLWWVPCMLVSVLTGGSPPPEPEIWGKIKEIIRIIALLLEMFHVRESMCIWCVNPHKCIFKVKQMPTPKQTADANVDFVQIFLYNTMLV